MERDYTDSQQNESQNINEQSSSHSNPTEMPFVDRSPEALAMQQLQQGINNSQEVQQEMEWQNGVERSEIQQSQNYSSPQQNTSDNDENIPKDDTETKNSPLSMDFTRIPFELVDWSSMGKKSFPLKKGVKLSIYKLVKKMGWPTDKATHAHIINYIRNYASNNQHLQLIDNNYLLNSTNQPLEIPSFRSYIAFFKKSTDPKFQQFYHEELGQYNYPPLITNIENQLYHTSVNYSNPITKLVENVPVAETLYGKWFMDRLDLAKTFFDTHGKMHGFSLGMLKGIPSPVSSVETDVEVDYGWYSPKAWKSISWEEKVAYFELGLDRRLEDNEGNLQKHYKDMLQKSDHPDADETRVFHSVEGEEIYDTWEQIILAWKEGWMNNAYEVRKNIKDYRKKIKDGSNLGFDQVMAFESMIETYEHILPILEKWEQPDHDAQKGEIASMKRYQEYLDGARFGYWYPSLECLEIAENILMERMSVAEQEEILKIPQYSQKVDNIRATRKVLLIHLNMTNTPSFDTFEQINVTKKLIESLHENSKDFPKLKVDFHESPVRSDFLLKKYDSIKNNHPNFNAQEALEKRSKRFTKK
jgi:hypothetical protein